jgi:hypothetical protein
MTPTSGDSGVQIPPGEGCNLKRTPLCQNSLLTGEKTGNVTLSTGALRRYVHSRDYFARENGLPATDQNRECAGNVNSLLRGHCQFDINCPHRDPRVIARSLFNRARLASWSRTRRQALSKLIELLRFGVILVVTYAARPQQFLAQRQQPICGDIFNCSGLLNSKILSSTPDATSQKISPRHTGNLWRFPVRPPGVSTRVTP